MGNNENSTSLHKLVHALFYKGFCPCIYAARSLVKYQHRRIRHSCTGYGKELPLALGKIGSVRCHHGIVTIREPPDK